MTSAAINVTDDGADADAVVAETLLGTCRTVTPRSRAKGRRFLDVPRSGETMTLLARSCFLKVLGIRAAHGVVDRNAEEAVHLRRVQGHRQNSVRAGRDQQVGTKRPPMEMRGASFLSERAYA